MKWACWVLLGVLVTGLAMIVLGVVVAMVAA